jgi:triosephosphate isomerase
MPTPIVAANWKMNGSRAFARAFVAELTGLAASSRSVQVLLFPPQVLLAELVSAVADAPFEVGVQTVHDAPNGAFTGETSAELAADSGARWTLAGHSERRQLFGEDDTAVAGRMSAARRAGLEPMLCVGETLDERRSGRAEAVVLAQLEAVLAIDARLPAAVAYEPVWAIGTGEVATPDQAQAMHAVIRRRLAEVGREETPILYGGSVKADNAAGLFARPDIDGALVGGASLEPESFAAIIAALGAQQDED